MVAQSTGAPATAPNSYTWVSDTTASVVLAANGSHQIVCEAYNGPTPTAAAVFDVNVDTQSPVVTFEGAQSSTATDAVWLTGTPTIAVVGSEPQILSGITQITCSVNGGSSIVLPVSAAENYTSSFELTQNGSDRISCQTTSGAGTVGVAATETVDLDNPSTAPGSGGVTKYGSSPLIDNGADPFSGGPSQTTWYHTEQQVTITADNTSGSAPIARISCTGASTDGGPWPIDNQNTDAQGGEKITVTVNAPGGDLACTATDAAGNVYSLGSYEFQIDDSAPTGAFVDQSQWPEPNEVELAVSDHGGSGVSVVRVYAQPLTGAAIDLGEASHDKSTGDYVITVPDGDMPAGSYKFYANVADVAGNQGQVTASPTGGTEQLVLPLRQTTAVTLTAANVTGTQDRIVPAPLQPSVNATSDVRPAAASVQAARGHALSASVAKSRKSMGARKYAKKLTEKFGKAVTLKGVLRNRQNHDKPIAQQKLIVYQLVSGKSKARKIGTVKTNAKGRYSYRARGGPDRILYVAYPGTHKLRPSVVQARETFTGKVTFHAGQVRAGGKLTITGVVKGGYIPAGGVEATVHFHQAGAPGSGVLGTIRTNKHGHFRFEQRFSRQVQGMRYQLWVTVGSQRSWPYKHARSRTITRFVR